MYVVGLNTILLVKCFQFHILLIEHIDDNDSKRNKLSPFHNKQYLQIILYYNVHADMLLRIYNERKTMIMCRIPYIYYVRIYAVLTPRMLFSIRTYNNTYV